MTVIWLSRRQRAYLLTELPSLAEAKASAAGSPVVALLVPAAELHVRADLDAAERDLTPSALDTLRIPALPRPSHNTSPAAATAP
jgi:hypothetical protein